MGNKVGRMFVKGFVKSFFIVLILIVVVVVSYQVAMRFLKTSESALVPYQEEPAQEPITNASVDDISKNLIYGYDEETGEITNLILEIFHSRKKEITYVTIPLQTRFTVSDTLYKELVLLQPAIPQMMKLTVLPNYFEEDTLFDYGVMLVEDLLEIDISYYTVIPKSQYDAIFAQKTEEDEDTGDKVPYAVFSKGYKEFLKKIKTDEELEAYLKEIYPTLRSNLSLKDKLRYLESYSHTSLADISFELMKGDNQNSGYIINRDLAQRQLAALVNEE